MGSFPKYIVALVALYVKEENYINILPISVLLSVNCQVVSGGLLMI